MSVIHLESKEMLPLTGKAVIDFYADWCGPCRLIGPKYEQMSQEFSDITFYKVNVDTEEGKDMAMALEVSAMPTFILTNNGNEVTRHFGANDKELRAKLEKM